MKRKVNLHKVRADELKPWDIVSQVLKMLQKETKPGISLIELNDKAEKMITDLKGESINKGYRLPHIAQPFPTAVCISVNNVIAHGTPTAYKLREGDIVSYDLGVKKDGLCGDAALTVAVGQISKRDLKLLTVAYEALYKGIEAVKAGVKIKDIGYAIESHVLRNGYVVNRTFCGHAIGEEMHQLPNIFNFFHESAAGTLEEGQMICIEPMVTESDKYGIRHVNGWTYMTRNGKNSAVFEHQLLVTKTGYKILTSWEK